MDEARTHIDTSEVEKRYREILSSWRSHKIATREQLSSVLGEYRVYFAYNSGRIENENITYHDTREIFENGKALSYTGDVRTLFEIQNQKDCHELLLDAFAAERRLDMRLLLEVHETLTKGTYDEARWGRGERPGHFKQHDYVVGASEVGLPAFEVRPAMEDLLEQISVITPKNALTVAAFFHATFEYIHPFADGNGRVGRTLLNYLLICNDHPPIIVYDEDKLAYYGALEAWDSEADLEALKDFLKVEMIRTWQRGV